MLYHGAILAWLLASDESVGLGPEEDGDEEVDPLEAYPDREFKIDEADYFDRLREQGLPLPGLLPEGPEEGDDTAPEPP